MSRQARVQSALRSTDRGDNQPCIGCARSAACADLKLACRAYTYWVREGVASPGKSREPSRRLFLQVMAGEKETE